MKKKCLSVFCLLLLLGFTCGCAAQSSDTTAEPFRWGLQLPNQVEDNEFMSSGEAVVHADCYNSDVANYPGITGINTELSFAYDPQNNSSLIFTDNAGHKITPYQGGIAIRDFSGEDIKTQGSFIPAADEDAAYILQTSYMYIDHDGRAVVPTNDGRILIISMTDEQGNVLEHFVKAAEIPVASLAAAAFPEQKVDKNLLSLVADYSGNIWFASGGMCVYPENYPAGFAGYVEYAAVQKLLAGQETDIRAATHFVLFEGREGLPGEAAENGISSSGQGVVVLTNLACYLFRPAADGSVEQVWKQSYESNGANVAADDAAYPGGGLAWGSGTTPTLSKNLVFFTDNADPISLLAVDLQSGELAAKQTVFESLDESIPVSVDNSIIVYGPNDDSNIVIIGNTFGLWSKGIYTDPEKGDVQIGGTLTEMSLIKNGNVALQPGLTRIDVNRSAAGDGYEAAVIWSRDEMHNSSVARLSAPGGRLYLYNQDLDSGVWQFEVLSAASGATLFTVPVGDSPGNNNCGAIVQIDPGGNKISMPVADRHLWSALDNFISVEGNDQAVVTQMTRSLPDIAGEAVGYLCGVSFKGAAAEQTLAVTLTDLLLDAARLNLYAQTAAGYQKLDSSLWSISERGSDKAAEGTLDQDKIYVLRLQVADNAEYDLEAQEAVVTAALQLVYE